MDNKQLIRLMGLARKTGSPLIITDPEGDEPVVIMGIDQYEVLMGVDGYDAEELNAEFGGGIAMEQFDDLPTVKEDDRMPGIADIDEILREENAENDDDDDLGEERFYLEPVE